LPIAGATTSEWQKRVCEETGMSRAQFYNLKAQLNERVTSDPKGIWSKKSNTSNQSNWTG
jgi:hypothetical protein